MLEAKLTLNEDAVVVLFSCRAQESGIEKTKIPGKVLGGELSRFVSNIKDLMVALHHRCIEFI